MKEHSLGFQNMVLKPGATPLSDFWRREIQVALELKFDPFDYRSRDYHYEDSNEGASHWLIYFITLNV